MSGLTEILVIWDLSCDHCDRPCAIRVVTKKGGLCIRCYFALGQPEAPDPTPEELKAVEERWAGVRSSRGAS